MAGLNKRRRQTWVARLAGLSALVWLLAGCAELKLPTGSATTTPVAAYVTPTPAMVFPPETSTVARIQQRGAMVVGIRYDLEPFSYISSQSGEISGLEADLARELARRWLGNPEAVRFVQVRSDTAIQHVNDGAVDFVLAGVVHTQQAEAQADFSPPYFINGLALLTFPDTAIQTVNDLEGRRVGVLTWTGSRAALAATVPVTPNYVLFDNFFQVVEALRTRQVEAYADQRHRLERARRMIAGSTIVGQVTQEPVALVYRQNDPFFANLVLLTFQEMAADGTRDALYARWLPQTSPPTLAHWPGTAPLPALSESPATLSTLNVKERIRQRGVLTVGYIQGLWPYSGDRDDGIQTGFEVRLTARLAERWLGSREAVTYVPVTRADGLQKLAAGEVDLLIGGWTPTREGELLADYSIPILNDGVGIFSLAYAPIQQPADLGGKAVGVVSGSAGEAALPLLSQAAGVGLSPVTFPDRDTAVAALQQGEVAALLAERSLVLEPLYKQPGFALTDARFTDRPICWVIPQGDSAYRDLVNLTLMWFQADGTYTELYRTWFDDPPLTLEVWPGNPAAPLNVQAP